MGYTTEIDFVKYLANNKEVFGNDIFRLRAMLTGFWCRIPYESEGTLERLYQDWVESEILCTETAFSWAEILFLYKGSKSKAVEMFFETIEPFYQREIIYKPIIFKQEGLFIPNHSIVDTLKNIKDRTLLYISKAELPCLASFIDGWYFRNPNCVEDWNVYIEFQNWIIDKYKISNRLENAKWYDYLYVYENGNGITKFYDLLYEYLSTFNSKQS